MQIVVTTKGADFLFINDPKTILLCTHLKVTYVP